MTYNKKVRFIILIILLVCLIIVNVKPNKNLFSRENFENKKKGMDLVLPKESTYEQHMELAKKIQKNKTKYEEPIIWHSYWNGDLNEKHLICIRSCYYFNVLGYKNRKIILWLEKNIPNHYNQEIKKYAEIKEFNYDREIKDTICASQKFYLNRENLPFYSDFIRTLLLLKYGGIWFDLDILFLKNMDCLFHKYGNRICVIAWEKQNYPNNAFYMCLQKNNPDMIHNIKFVMNQNRGWGFQEANLTFDKDLKMLVLPCAWIDPAWINSPIKIGFDEFFKPSEKKWTFNNFHPGSFAFHWHNRWKSEIHNSSVCRQLDNIIQKKLESSGSHH